MAKKKKVTPAGEHADKKSSKKVKQADTSGDREERGSTAPVPASDGGKRLYPLDIEQFSVLLDSVQPERRIDAIHLHGSWRPDHAADGGRATLAAMARFHVEQLGLRDLAQHLTIDRRGGIWIGRHWDLPPVSIRGHNGNEVAGPLMVQLIGDFDQGRDAFHDPQREATIAVLARLVRRFDLDVRQLAFAWQLSNAQGNGREIDTASLREEVEQAASKPTRAASRDAKAKHPHPLDDSALDRGAVDPLLADWKRPAENDDPIEEIEVRGFSREQLVLLMGQPLAVDDAVAGTSAATRPQADRVRDKEAAQQRLWGSTVAEEILTELAGHVVNLTAGRYSSDGNFRTQPEDVAALFGEHLPAWWAQQDNSGPLRIVLYAHGGLTSEKDGLLNAYKHLRWWKANGVYPICFVWETGFGESIWQLLTGATRAARGVAPRAWTDASDRVLESAARRLGGKLLWSGMKRSAQQTFARGGAGRDFTSQLRTFCNDWTHGDIELHAAGHSAGSIFLSHGIPYMLDHGVPAFQTLHFLAPAIRHDQFRQQLLPRIGAGRGVEHLTVYTMRRPYELADSVGPYRKSLLYLIHYALEDKRETPILGLEVSLRRDPQVGKLLGLGTHGVSPAGEVVWSLTPEKEGRSSSRSNTHGGFDDDTPTLDSVVRRIKGLDDRDPIVSYRPPPALASRAMATVSEFFADEELLPGGWEMGSRSYGYPYYVEQSRGRGAAGSRGGGGPSSRRALCIGIDDYPEAPLYGCVSDANRWETWFRDQGFQVQKLTNGQATRQAILDSIGDLIRGSRTGDVIAIQFSGHGTQVPDLDGDEADGDTPGFDEALVPVDHRRNGYVIDDELGELCDQIPDGVNVTFLMDCCHSGTNTRLLLGAAPPPEPGARKRYLPPDEEMIETHLRTHRQYMKGGSRSIRSADSWHREIAYAACRSDQVAWESRGQGDFTRNALKVLGGGVSGLSHDEFQRRVEQEFGQRPRQNPQLNCDDRYRGEPLLAARGVATGGGGVGSPPLGGSVGSDELDLREFVKMLKQLLDRVRV